MPPPIPSRYLRNYFCAVLLWALASFGLHAESTVPAANGRIYSTVTDSAGNVIAGAQVTLDFANTKQTQTTDGDGVFNFTTLAPGSYKISVSSEGFRPYASPEIPLAPGQYYNMPPIQLQIAAASTSVRVTFSSVELAQQQVHAEEKQRVLGVFPNFYTSYIWDAEPLTTGQKFQIALRTSVDPVTFIATGAIAGIQQWQNSFSGYGQGAEGYAKRYGANYANAFTGVVIGGAILPSILHQDPRYFYKGTGTIKSRTLYAISTVFITKGDNGRWQPNYSNVLGTFAAAGISNAYYPASNRGVGLTFENSFLGLAGGAASALFQEFLIRKISRGVPPVSAAQP